MAVVIVTVVKKQAMMAMMTVVTICVIVHTYALQFEFLVLCLDFVESLLAVATATGSQLYSYLSVAHKAVVQQQCFLIARNAISTQITQQ